MPVEIDRAPLCPIAAARPSGRYCPHNSAGLAQNRLLVDGNRRCKGENNSWHERRWDGSRRQGAVIAAAWKSSPMQIAAPGDIVAALA